MNATADEATPDCFSDQILGDFNSGKLQDLLLEQRVAEHLESCANCESRLSALPRDSIVQLLCEPNPLGPLIDCRRLSQDQSLASTKSHLNGDSEPAEGGVLASVRPPSEALPVKIDCYFVVRELGSGGFARVFLAKDPRYNHSVAIKVSREDRLTTGAGRRAFLKEARTVAVLVTPTSCLFTTAVNWTMVVASW